MLPSGQEICSLPGLVVGLVAGRGGGCGAGCVGMEREQRRFQWISLYSIVGEIYRYFLSGIPASAAIRVMTTTTTKKWNIIRKIYFENMQTTCLAKN